MSAKQQKRLHIIISICIEMTRHYKRIGKRKRQYLHLSAFRRIGPFLNQTIKSQTRGIKNCIFG